MNKLRKLGYHFLFVDKGMLFELQNAFGSIVYNKLPITVKVKAIFHYSFWFALDENSFYFNLLLGEMAVKTIFLVLLLIYSCNCDIECSYESEQGVFYDFTNLK